MEHDANPNTLDAVAGRAERFARSELNRTQVDDQPSAPVDVTARFTERPAQE
ncbi:MAG TPA: hypothetical protein VFW30_10555 [Bryocella sp.]|nr:hypothetical protein [Bryocella sp.]